jgi:hypothetical protein
MQKKIFFSYNLSAGTSPVLKILFFAKVLYLNLVWEHYFSQLNTFMRKGKDPGGPKTWASGPDPDPQHWLRG